MPEFHVAIALKLRLDKALNLGGCLSQEFAIFEHFFCVDLPNALH